MNPLNPLTRIKSLLMGFTRLRDGYLKNGVSKGIVHMTKHANLQLYRAYPARFIWKRRQLVTNTYTKELHFLYIKRGVSPKNVLRRKNVNT